MSGEPFVLYCTRWARLNPRLRLPHASKDDSPSKTDGLGAWGPTEETQPHWMSIGPADEKPARPDADEIDLVLIRPSVGPAVPHSDPTLLTRMWSPSK